MTIVAKPELFVFKYNPDDPWQMAKDFTDNIKKALSRKYPQGWYTAKISQDHKLDPDWVGCMLNNMNYQGNRGLSTIHRFNSLLKLAGTLDLDVTVNLNNVEYSLIDEEESIRVAAQNFIHKLDKTQKAIGKECGIDQSAVSRLKHNTSTRLRGRNEPISGVFRLFHFQNREVNFTVKLKAPKNAK